MSVDDKRSYWQRGCDDAKAGKPPAQPFTREQLLHPPTGWTAHSISLANDGYENGYHWWLQTR